MWNDCPVKDDPTDSNNRTNRPIQTNVPPRRRTTATIKTTRTLQTTDRSVQPDAIGTLFHMGIGPITTEPISSAAKLATSNRECSPAAENPANAPQSCPAADPPKSSGTSARLSATKPPRCVADPSELPQTDLEPPPQSMDRTRFEPPSRHNNGIAAMRRKSSLAHSAGALPATPH